MVDATSSGFGRRRMGEACAACSSIARVEHSLVPSSALCSGQKAKEEASALQTVRYQSALSNNRARQLVPRQET
jgi:hypothetical protein